LLSYFIALEFLRQIFEKSSNIKFNEIRRVGTELFHEDGKTDRQADRQTDMAKRLVAFRKFANAPKSSWVINVHVENETINAIVEHVC
jgi:Fe-S-cluster formation regulator IscX/YfhJ